MSDRCVRSVALVGILVAGCTTPPPSAPVHRQPPPAYRVQVGDMPDGSMGVPSPRRRTWTFPRRAPISDTYAGYWEDQATCNRYYDDCLARYSDPSRCERVRQACLARFRPNWPFWRRWWG